MDPKTCPGCGASIDADYPQGLCPACLLQQGLKADRPTGATRLPCPSCQGTLGEGVRFCPNCGAPAPAAAGPGEGDAVRTA